MIENETTLNCIIISEYPFPIGLAPTNRILAYSKALLLNSADVEVIIPFPTDKYFTTNDYPTKGIYQGIRYSYTSCRYKSRIKLIRMFAVISYFRKIFGYLSSISYMYWKYKTKTNLIILISSDQSDMLWVYSKFAKLLKANSVFIFDEYPIPIRAKLKNSIPKLKEFIFRNVLKNIDGYVSISSKLEKFYNSLCEKPTFLLPIIVDESRFDSKIIDKKESANYLCYMGNMELSKDDLVTIIKAFSIISGNYPYLNLHLYGPHRDETTGVLKKLIKELNLFDRVLLKGKISSELVPSVLCNAHILVAAQPNTTRASGGFPTKLGEYLLSGKPSLFTNVGENARYIKDAEHVFFVEPENTVEYAKKISLILENYEKALLVAASGRKYLIENYSQLNIGHELKEFLIRTKKASSNNNINHY